MKKILTLALACFGLAVQGQGPQATPVYVEKIHSETTAQIKSIMGNLKAAQEVKVAALESGRVEEFLVKEGQKVEKGDLIARLDDRHIVHDIKAVEAQLLEIGSRCRLLKAELVLYREDLKDLMAARKDFAGAVSNKELRVSRLQVVTAEGQLETLSAEKRTMESRLAKLKTSFADMRIKAPFTGVVQKRFVDLGAWVQAGGSVISLISADKLEAWLFVPSSIAVTDAMNKNFLRIYAGETEKNLPFSNLRLIPDVNETSRNYTIVAEIDKSAGLLHGMALRADVAAGSIADQVFVSANAIGRNGAGYFVYKVQKTAKGDVALPTPLKVLFYRGSEVAIAPGGLKSGDRVVVEGNERLFPMMPIKPMQKPTITAKAEK